MKTQKHIPFAQFAHKFVACLLAFCIVNIPVLAIEVGDVFSTQNASVDIVEDHVLTNVEISGTHGIIDWNSVDTIQDENLNFARAGGGSFAALNNVISGNPTTFAGILNAPDGFIIFVNDAGLVFTSTSVISADRFIASTKLIDNQDFMDDIYKFSGDGIGTITNEGSISAEKVALIANTVNNAGTISSPDGYTVLAAGDYVYLGDAGGKIIVEMDSVADGSGSVTNTGSISADNGKIILAAGDIYAVPLHPQLQVGEIDKAVNEYDYSVPEDKAVIDLQPVRVETGTGTVTQDGGLPDGGITAVGGQVILTAGDNVVLEDGSDTEADSVIVYAYDFGDKEATTSFNDGATIDVTSGGDLGFAGINGNHILFDGVVVADPGATIQVDPVTLTIADDEPAEGPAVDTLYEEMIEDYSDAGVNLDLAADEMITVELMADGIISGGSGDIALRNVFETGGIEFVDVGGEKTAINTTATTGDGGNIYMTSGSGGIIAGDLYTTTPSNDKTSNPGRIILQTTNGGDLEVGSMITKRGNTSEISAISSGNLTVNGEVISQNQTVSKDAKDVGFARICLVAMGDVTVDAEGGSIAVESHGKYSATADIIICAGENITITNVNGGIEAFAQTSENTVPIQTANARVDISAGGNQVDPAVISINGITFDPAGDNSDLPVSAYAKASGSGPLDIDTTDTPVAGDPGELIWQDTLTDPEPVDDYDLTVKLEINNNEQIVPGEMGSPCYECPTPPGLPPVPHIFWIMDDSATMSWSAELFPLNVLDNDDNGSPLDGAVSSYITTQLGGTLTPVYDNGDIVGFEYTPPEDAVFVWDGVSAYAVYTDTFTYQAEDAEGNISLNTATVTLTVTNILPVLSSDSDTIHMSTASDPTSADFVLGSLVYDEDGTPGTITYGIVEGEIPVSDGSIATDTNPGGLPDTLTISDDTITYSPYQGYVSPTDEPTTFGYSVTDSSIVDNQQVVVEQTEDLDVTVTNELPSGSVVLEDADMDAIAQELEVDSGSFADTSDNGNLDDFIIAGIDPATDDYNMGFGGDLSYNGTNDPYNDDVDGTYDYTADSDLPGYTGPDEFDVQLWDGQLTYYVDGSSTEVYGEGTISLEITNTPPGGDAWFGQVHMDSQDVTQPLEVDFSGNFDIAEGTYTGEVIGSDLYGGTLVYDNGSWTYSTDTDLPGYVGDNNDDYGQGGYVADDLFTVDLSNGQFDYWFGEGEPPEGYEYYAPSEIYRKAVYGEGTVSVDITNALPTIDEEPTIEHMNESITDELFATDDLDGNPINELDDLTMLDEVGDPTTTYTTDFGIDVSLTDNGDGTYSYTYDPADGYVGDDSFEVTVWDGQINYVFDNDGLIDEGATTKETVSGTVSLQMTNLLPTAVGDLGEAVPGDPIPQDGLTSPVNVTDPLDAPQEDFPFDDVEIVPDIYFSASGSSLTFDGTSWTYDPAPGAPATEEFTIKLWDGERYYYNIEESVKVYGYGTVKVSAAAEIVPVAPLPLLEIPELKGCPVVMDAAASELAINSDELQLLIGNAMATNPNLQPCNTCESLLSAANAMKSGAGLDALAQLFNTLAPADAPFTPEVSASVATAFAEMADDPQYALAMEFVDAFVDYVAAINDLQMPVGDATALVMEKYGEQLADAGNPNIAAYISAQLEASMGGGL